MKRKGLVKNLTRARYVHPRWHFKENSCAIMWMYEGLLLFVALDIIAVESSRTRAQ